MDVSLSSDAIKPLWIQLFRNIGFSKHYKRYVIVEPLCYLTENNSNIQLASVDQIVYHNVKFLGNQIAAYIDKDWGDDIEQILVFNKKYNIIIVTDEERLFKKQRLPELLTYLRKRPGIARNVVGLIHYHIDEPKLSCFDIEAIDQFTTEIKLINGLNQNGIVVSEADPRDSLEILKHGSEAFVNHLCTKLKIGEISIGGCLFQGNRIEPDSVSFKLLS